MAFDITGQLNLRLASGALRNISNEINSGLRGVGGARVPVRADMSGVKNIRTHIDAATSAVDRFSQQSGLAFKRFAAFSVAALPFLQVASGIQKAVAEGIEFDRQMVRLRQVASESASELGDIRNEVTRLSTSYGVSSQELAKMAVVLKQADFTARETKIALETLAEAALAPNFDSMTQTGEGAIAVMKQFGLQADQLKAAIGSMNAVAGAFAVEAGDLVEVVRRAGGAFKASGGDLNELLALFTSVRQTTRESAESIATGLRTIFTRIQRNDTVNALKEFGVNLRYTREEAEKSGNLGLTNQFVGAYEAISRLSRALTQMPSADPRFSAIVEDLGGYRQISKVIPLINEMAISERALMVAEAGRVSLQVSAAQAADSYSNRLSKLQEQYLAFGRSLLDTDSFKGAFSGFETLAKGMLLVLEAAKPLIPLLTTIATMKLVQNMGSIYSNFQKGANPSAPGNLLGKSQGGVIRMAKGGIVPGSGSGDTVPALLEPGELVVPRRHVRKMAGGGQHRQPWLMTMAEFDAENPHNALGRIEDREKAFNQLPDSAKVWVYHATTHETANKLLKEGVVQSRKPQHNINPDATRYSQEFGPGKGLDSGIYVGARPVSIVQYGERVLALSLAKSLVQVPPEGRYLNKSRTPGRAIADSDAVVRADIHHSSIVDVTGSGDGRFVLGHEAFVRKALAEGKFVPESVLADYPHLSRRPTRGMAGGGAVAFLDELEMEGLRKKKGKKGQPPKPYEPLPEFETVVGRFVQAYQSEKGQAFAPFYDLFRQKMEARLGPSGDPRRDLYERMYAFQSQGAQDKKVIEVTARAYNRYRKRVTEGKKVTANSFRSLMDSLGLNKKASKRKDFPELGEIGTRSMWMAKALAGEAPATQKKADYHKGLVNPNFYPVDRNVIYTAFDTTAKDAEERGLLQVGESEYRFFHSAVAEAAKRLNTSGQRIQAAIFGARSRQKPDIEGTVASLDKLVPYAGGGVVPGTGNTDSVPAYLPHGSFVIRKSSVRSLGLGGSPLDAASANPNVMLMPGEFVVTPEEARRVGLSKLDHMNRTGRLPRMAFGGKFLASLFSRQNNSAASPFTTGPAPNEIMDLVNKLSDKQLSQRVPVKQYLKELFSQVRSEQPIQHLDKYIKDTPLKVEDKTDANGFYRHASGTDPGLIGLTKDGLRNDALGIMRHEAIHAADHKVFLKHQGKLPTNPLVQNSSGDYEGFSKETSDLIKQYKDRYRGLFLSDTIQSKTGQSILPLMPHVERAFAGTKHQNYLMQPAEILAWGLSEQMGTTDNKFTNRLKEHAGTPQKQAEIEQLLKNMRDTFVQETTQLSGNSPTPQPTPPSPTPPSPTPPRPRVTPTTTTTPAPPRTTPAPPPPRTTAAPPPPRTTAAPPPPTTGAPPPPPTTAAPPRTTAAPPPPPPPTTGAPPPTTSAPPPPRSRRPYDPLNPRRDFQDIITSAASGGNRVDSTARTVGTYKNQDAVRMLGDMAQVSGSFTLISKSIEDTLKVTRPYLTAQQRRTHAENEAIKLISKGEQALIAENRAAEARNVQKQAAERGGKIDQMYALQADARQLRRRARFGDTVAEAQLRNEVMPQLRQTQREINRDENMGLAVGSLRTSRADRLQLRTYRNEYRTQEQVQEQVAQQSDATLSRIRKELEGLEISSVQDARGRSSLKFGGAASLVDAGFEAPARQTARERRASLSGVLDREIRREMVRRDQTGRGRNLSDATRQQITEQQTARIRQQYVEGVALQIQQQQRLRSLDDARSIASQQFEAALQNRTQVTQRGGQLLDTNLLNQGYRGGFRQRLRNVASSIGQGIRSGFSEQTGYFGLQAAGSYAAAAFAPQAGAAEQAVLSGNPGDASNFTNRKALSGAFSGAASGAAVGFSLGGPYGAAAGAVGGALLGLATSIRDAAAEIGEAKIAVALKQTNDALTNFAKGTYNLNPLNAEILKKNMSTIEVESSRKAARNADATGFGFQFMFGENAYLAEASKISREANANQAAPMMDALTKIIEEQAQADVGNQARQDRAGRKASFNEALAANGGVGRSLLGRVASATQQDPFLLTEKLFKSFERTQENEARKREQEKGETAINRSAAVFSSLSSAVESASQRLARMTSSMKNLSDVMDANVSSYSGQGLTESLQKPFSASDEFMSSVRSVTKLAGGAPEVEAQANAIAVTGKVLPSIINAVRSQPVAALARGADMSLQVGDRLREALAAAGVNKAESSMMVSTIQSQLGAEDFSKLLRESGQDMGKLIQKILGPMADPLKQSFTEIGKTLDERAKTFADGLAELANRTRATGELIDKANQAQMASDRYAVETAVRRRQVGERGADAMNMAASLRFQQERQSRLTGIAGGGAQDPDFIANRLRSAFAQINQAEKRVDAASRGGDIKEQNAAAGQLTNLKSRAADLNQALKNLTDVSERTAAAQERLGKIQADREGRQALGMRYATANAEGRAEIARSFQLLNAAARLGTAAPFGIREQNQIFSLLSSLSPQMRLQGLGGVSVKELTSQLMTTTFGGAFDLDPQTAAMERALENFVQTNYETAARAAQLQVDLQKNLQAEFFTRLNASQDAFLAQLAKVMQENSRMMAQSLKMQAQSRLNDLEKQVGDASILGKIGVTTQPQFDAVKNAMKNGDEIQRMFAAGREMANIQTTKTQAAGLADQLAARMAAISPEVSTKNLSKSEAAISLMNQFSEMGITKKEDQQELLKILSSKLDQLPSAGTLGANPDLLKQGFVDALNVFSGRRMIEQTATMTKAQAELADKGVVDPAIIAKIATAARANGGDITLTSLQEAVKAVASTNIQFTELNKTLEEFREKIRAMGRAEGGPIRFFNKGGWGSGGSNTPHPSDTVNARIAPDEFVVSSGPARRNRALLEHMNRGGPVHFAGGGPVTAQGNIAAARGLMSGYGGETFNNVGAKVVADQALASLRANSEIAFVQRLKAMKPGERENFISDQLAKAADIKDKTVEQQGYFDALTKLKEKITIRDNTAKKRDAEINKMTITADNLKEYHKSSVTAAVAWKVQRPGFEVDNYIKDIKKMQLEIVNQYRAAYDKASQIHKIPDGDGLLKVDDMIKTAPDLAKHNYLVNWPIIQKAVADSTMFQELFESWGEPKVMGQEIRGGSANGRAGTRQRMMDEIIKEWDQANNIVLRGLMYTTPFALYNMHRHEQIEEEDLVNKRIISEKYGGNVRTAIQRWYDGIMHDKEVAPTGPDEFAADVLKAYRDLIKKRVEGRADLQFNLDAEIDKIINDLTADARVNQLRPDTDKVAEAVKEVTASRSARAQGFLVASERLQKVMGTVNAENFGVNDVRKIQQAQLGVKEVDAFNRLDAATQARELEKAKSRIMGGELSAVEKKQLDQIGMGKAIGASKDIGADEINSLIANRSKMTVLQRAAADIFLEMVARESKLEAKADAGSDSMTETERALYLTQVDLAGREYAVSQMNDPKKQGALMRMARFMAINQGLIDSRLSAAEEKGPAEYAKEAALLELLSSTPLPKASERFKGKPFGKNKGVAPAAVAEPLPGFASGGLVPGVGNTDSVYAHLAQGSYVIRKSSVNSIGADNLHAMSKFASGGVVPAMVMPGEYVFGPKQAAAIGANRLDSMNKTGRLPGYAKGGWAGMPQANPGFMWVQVPAQQAAMFGRGMMQPQQAVANLMQDQGLMQQQMVARNQGNFAQIQQANQVFTQYDGNFVRLKSEFFQIRNKLARTNPRQRTKEDIARYRELLSYVNNPVLIQMDREQQLAAVQEQVGKFAESPQAFLGQIPELRKIIADRNMAYEERLAAKEQLDQILMASRMVDQNALREKVVDYRKRVADERRLAMREQREEAAAAANDAAAAANIDMTNPANAFHLRRAQEAAAEKPGIDMDNPANAFHLNQQAAPAVKGLNYKNPANRYHLERMFEKKPDNGVIDMTNPANAFHINRQAAASAADMTNPANEYHTKLRQARGFAAGGIVPGTGSRDTVPALLTPGEMVVPKHQVQKFAAGGMVGGTSGSFSDVMDAANRFNQAAAQIGQGLSGFSTSVNAFGESVGTFGEFVARFDEAVGKIPEEITLSGVDGVSVNITGQESIVRAVTEALGPMIAEAIRNSQPVEQRSS